MASRNVSPPRRPVQLLHTPHLKGSDRLTVPKYHIADPLLGTLSPESTLLALSSTNAVPNKEQAAHDILSKSISQASPTERALGIRAAVAAQKLGQWYRELQTWKWPKRTDAHLGKGFISPSDVEESVYCGSLPVAVVDEHEKRLDEIRDGMDSLDVEELKEHVLNAHIPGRSRPSSANSTMSVPPPLSYIQLSDFTAVITATILRALPLLSRLNNLLSTWHVRLLVIRQIPGLLQSLRFARSELNSALNLLKSSVPPTEKEVLYSITNYHAKRAALESMVVSAGRRMDRILDSLDGREDTLPESWIDDLEAIEADFATWVMQAERRTVENEWRRLAVRPRQNDRPQPQSMQPQPDACDIIQKPTTDTSTVLSPKASAIECTDSADITAAPQILPQTRPTPLQTGRTPLLETIVEEIGSPFKRPLSDTAGNIAAISAAEARTTPESPTPLPSDPVDTQEALDLIPAMELDAGRDIATPADAPHVTPQNIPQNLPQSPVNMPPVEDPLPIPQNSDDNSSAEPSIEELISPPKEEISLPPSGSRADDKYLGEPKPVASPDTRSASLAIFEAVSPEPTQQNNESTAICSDKEYSREPEPVALLDTRPSSLPNVEVVRVEPMQQNSDLTTICSEAQWLGEPKPMTGYDTQSPGLVGVEPVRTVSIQPKDESADIRPDEKCSEEPKIPLPSSPNTAFIPAEPMQQDDESPSQTSPEVTPPQTLALSREQDAEIHPVALYEASTEYAPLADNDVTPPESEPKANEELEPIGEVDGQPQSPSAEDEQPALVSATVESPSLEIRIPPSANRCGTPPNDSVASLPNLFMPFDSSRAPVEQTQSEGFEQQDKDSTSKKPLDSPIKLSKARPGRLDLDKHNSKPRVRQASDASDGSLSDFPSLVSSPEMPEPRTSSTNGTPLLFKTPPHFPTNYRPSDSVRQSSDHVLREDRLLHLDAQKPSPREQFTHNRTLSLPLQRFINERLEMNYDHGSGTEGDDSAAKSSKYGKKGLAARRQKSKSATSPGDIRRLDPQHLAPTREESSGADSEPSSEPQREAHRQDIALHKKPARPLPQAAPLSSKTTGRLKKRLTAHPSLESLGPYKSNTRPAGGLKNAKLQNTKSRPSSPSKQLIRPKDQMDVKINSILTTLPGGIHLVPADQDDDTMSVASSLPFRRERFRSHSPQGNTPSRSITPTPSLTLRPMGRRRHSHAPEESSMKLYHLHRGGKSAPTKLFVRTVGETGERVMVRVGGGWADLAEYLREYAIHHGRRHVSETPRVEVEGLSSRESPSYSPPASRLPSGSGRHTPARPRSVISNRPSSSVAVRKIRRSSNVSDFADVRSASGGDALNVSFSPMSSAFPDRRMSVSSNVSAGAVSSVSDVRHGSPGNSHAMPLGLAGPKPRAKHATISPESEAWVEDVLGQARRSSSLRPLKNGLQSQENESDGASTPILPKSRSISDIGKAGSSKRVVLRGLR
ncbi:hypothetical protein BDW59DRAFT_143318 [Aspergillus cavernicola]|uniref:GAR domain-containing protein n=1 Tax=Aspergillus cavernicola TaxID=176166 RepID=A0ABR4IK85_9EURO